jgi:succinate dehydrogenase / fumarate reductase flavoprotein subunit
MEAEWRRTLLVCRTASDAVVPDVSVTKELQPPMREDLLEVFEVDELSKYFTDEELAQHPGRRTQ